MKDLETEFGPLDIYLFDQLLRGQIAPGMRVLDAGCGSGRNLIYLLRSGYDVKAVDTHDAAIAAVKALAAELAPSLPSSNFRHEPIERMSFEDGSADVVISSAVLHFAKDDAHFEAMLYDMWRVLAPGGLLFSRLASTIGIEQRVQPIRGRWHRLPDQTERYLVDEARLLALTRDLGGTLVDPLKTTVVQDQRSMTTWVVRKPRRLP